MRVRAYKNSKAGVQGFVLAQVFILFGRLEGERVMSKKGLVTLFLVAMTGTALNAHADYDDDAKLLFAWGAITASQAQCPEIYATEKLHRLIEPFVEEGLLSTPQKWGRKGCQYFACNEGEKAFLSDGSCETLLKWYGPKGSLVKGLVEK